MSADTRLSTCLRDMNNWTRQSAGWKLCSESTSGWPFLDTNVCVDWHPPISLMNSIWRWTLCLWLAASSSLSIACVFPSLVTKHFRLLPLFLGRAGLNTSAWYHLCKSSEHVRIPPSSCSSSDDCKVLHTVTCRFGHFSRLFTTLHCSIVTAAAVVVCSICKEFETIAERALQQVATTEQLIEMIDYIEEARTNGMRKLNERVVVSQLWTTDLFMFSLKSVSLI